MKSIISTSNSTGFSSSFVRSFGTPILLLVTQCCIYFSAFAQLPLENGACSRNTLEFSPGANTGTTAITGFDYAEGSIEAWVKKDNWSDPYDDALFSNGIGYPFNNSFYISFHSGVGLHFRYGGSADGGNVAAYASNTSTDTLAANSWHHIAATWENDGNATSLAIYIDAQLVSTATTSSNLILNTSSPFGLGFGIANYLYDFQGGAMAEVSVWNVAKSQAEIAADMNRLLAADETGLIAYWPLDDASGTAEAANLIQPTETLPLLDFSDFNEAWVPFPLGIQTSGERLLSGETHDFGIVNSSETITITLTNQATSPLTFPDSPIATLAGTNADQFTLDFTGTSTTLSAGASTTFSISFNPQSAGVKEATLAIANVADCPDPYSIHLTGTSPDLSLSYSGSGFTEQAANDGSVTGSITITLYEDTFQDDDMDNLLDEGSEVTIGNVPAGLTPILTLNSATEAVMTLTGNASSHQDTDDVATITFEFADAAFTTYPAASITNATGPASSGVGIGFTNNPAITYSGEGFVETTANDGTVIGSISAKLSGGFFATKSTLDHPTDYTISHLPDGLSPSIAVKNNVLTETWIAGSGTAAANWTPVAFGNGLYVTLASGTNDLMTSENGETWTTGTSPSSNTWTSIAYGAGKFVAVSNTGTGRIISSTDAINWTAISNFENIWFSVVYGGGRFVIVGPYGNVLTSTDGESWTQASGPSAGWRSVTYGNGMYVAVSYYGSHKIMTSTDGTTWTAQTAPAANDLQEVTFGNGVFVAIGKGTGNYAMTSSDGINWTAQTIPNGNWKDITFGEGIFMAVGDGASAIVSSDGVSWSQKTIPNGNWNGVTYGNGKFVAVANGGTNHTIYTENNIEAKLTLSGAAAFHDNTDDLSDITFTFHDSAFDEIPSSSVINATNANSELGINFFETIPTLSYAGSGFTETASNTGAVEGAITITLTEDTFLDDDANEKLEVGSQVTINNVPDGLTPVITLNSSTEAALTLTGNATLHQDSVNVAELTFQFEDAAFSSLKAEAITNATGPAGSSLGVSFTNNPFITLSGETFTETSANDGSVSGSLIIDLSGDTYSSSIAIGNGVALENLPAGFTASLTSNSSTQIEITLTGTATNHEAEHNLAELLFSLTDAAFANSNVNAVLNASGTINAGVGISFVDRPVLSYSGVGFSEFHSNNGRLEGYININLEGETFSSGVSDPVGNKFLEHGVHYTITNLPSGLIPIMNVYETSAHLAFSTEAFADAHQPADDISNLILHFYDTAFTSVGAANIANATNASTGLGISFNYARGSLSFSGGYTEPEQNDGSLEGSMIITLTGDTFADPDMDGLLTSGDQVYVSRPYQMTSKLTLLSPTELEVKFEGNAQSHDDSDDEPYVSFEFYDQAFTNSNSAEITNASYYHNGITIDFLENASVTYTGPGFTETHENKGAVSGSITIDLINDTFSDPDDNGFLTVPGQLNIEHLPEGLTPVASLTSSSQLVLTLTGKAVDHESHHDVSSLNFQFTDDAFTLVKAQYVENTSDAHSDYYTSDLGIDFDNRPKGISFEGDGFTETTANDGSVAGEIKVFLADETFADDGDGLLDLTSQVTLGNVPPGLTPSLTINSNKKAGYDWTSTFHSGNSPYLAITYGDGLFVALANYNSNRLATSPDGLNWTKSTVLDMGVFGSVTYGNGIYVAVCSDGSYFSYTSTDGINWTPGAELTETGWQEVIYANGTFVATKSHGTNRVMTSTDGANWTLHLGHPNVGGSLAYGNGLFISTNTSQSQRVAISSNALDWTSQAISDSDSYSYGMSEIAFGNGVFVITCDYAEDSGIQNSNVILTSTDGINWNTHEVANTEMYGVVYGEGIFVAHGDNNVTGEEKIYISADGATWEVLEGVPGFGWNDAIYANGGFVTVNQGWSNDAWGQYQIMTSFPKAAATLTLTGNADDHQALHDVSDITFDFADAAFANALAADVPNATGPASSGLGIAFADNTPPNDDCTSPQALSVYIPGEGVPTNGSTEFAVPNANQNPCTGQAGEKDVWYAFNSGDSGQVIFTVDAGETTTIAGAIYTVCGEILMLEDPLGGNPNPACALSLSEPLFVKLSPNTDFLIQAWSAEGAEGDFTVLLESNAPPVIDAIADTVMDEETELQLTVTATDDFVPLGNIEYYLDSQSSELGMQINTISGAFTWTPAEDQNGSYEVVAYAVDYSNQATLTSSYSSTTFHITVNEVNMAPELDTLITQQILPQTGLAYKLSATDADLPAQTLTFTIDQASIDKGVILDASDSLKWTPQPAHYGTTHLVEVTVSDGALAETGTLTINVDKADQEISFTPIADKHYLDEPFKLMAKGGGSGHSVIFSTNDEDVISIAGDFVTIIGIGTATIYANQMGNNRYHNAVEVSQTFTINGPSTNTWTGTYWTSGTAPTANEDAIIDGDYVFSEQGVFAANNLTINADATLTVDAASNLVVNGDLSNDGNMMLTAGSSLLTYGSVTGSGFRIERGTTFDQHTGRYSIVGAPVQHAGFDALGQHALVYAYDESAPYNASGNKGLDKFRTPAQLEILEMTPAAGYFSAFTGDETGQISFSGTPNHGAIQIALSYTDQGTAEETPHEGFNLVSNPYPAAISFTSLLAGNSHPELDGSIYLWDDYGSDSQRGTNADYLIVNPTLGNTNSRAAGEQKWDGYIRSGQGFFVKANASTTLHFSDDMKVTDHNSDGGFFRKAAVRRYKLAINDGKNSKATIVGFVSGATPGKDHAYDALTFGEAGLQLYSLQAEGNHKLGIQGLPLNFQGEVKLGFSCATATEHTISLLNLEEVDQDLLLYDSYLGKTTDLTTQAYTFTTGVGQFEDRFVMLAAKPLAATNARTLIYAYDKTLHIEAAGETAQYQIYNLSGARVFTALVHRAATIDLSHLSAGVYLVSDGSETLRIILK